MKTYMKALKIIETVFIMYCALVIWLGVICGNVSMTDLIQRAVAVTIILIGVVHCLIIRFKGS